MNSENEKTASADSESDGQVSGPNICLRSKLAKEFITEQGKRGKKAERRRSLSSKRSSFQEAAAALKKITRTFRFFQKAKRASEFSPSEI